MRDRRLDLWRGLCLIDMILVHLAHEGVQFGVLTPWIVDYTRFAAGGFVFVAGLGVGLVFLPRLRARGTRSLRASTAVLWTRALYLLGVHYALTGIMVALDVLRGTRAPAADPVALVLDVALLREAPPYIDVLPLYVAMLLVTPAVFALLRHGLWPLVAVVSTALFAYGRHDPSAFSPAGSVEFPFLLWQAFFVAGLLFSVIVPRLDRSRRAWRVAMAGAWAAFVVTTAFAYGPRFDVVPELSFVSFEKVPLTTGELCRYLAAILVVLTTTAVAWRYVRDSTSAAAVATLGRRSLVVYGGHVFLQMVVILAITPLWWIGSAQALAVVPVLAGAWLLARVADRWDARAAQRSARAAQRSARAAQRSARAAQRSARAAQRSARAAQRSARAAQRSARAAQRSARAAQRSARAARWDARAHRWADLRRACKGWGAAPAGLVAAALLIVVVRPPLPAELGVEVTTDAPSLDDGINLVDAVEEPSFTPDVPIDATPFDAAPEIEDLDTLDDDETIESGLATSLVV